MRKLMLLAAMLAMVLVAAAPALAQDAGVSGDGDATGGDSTTTTTTTETQYQTQAAAIVQDCSVNVNQGQYGDASGEDSTITTTIGDVTGAQCQAIINQVQAGNDAVGAVNAVLGDVIPAPAPETPAAPTTTGGTTTGGTTTGTTTAADEAGVTTLPNTGGASLFTLGAGALLVGGGLLARRIFS